jgi:serine/threonine-protein phosphatase 2A regulatory subunit A
MLQLLAAVVEKEFMLSELLPLFHALAGDDQDSVRLLAIENCTAFAKVLNASENNKHILPLVKTCASDKSWRVRNNVAKEFYSVRSQRDGHCFNSCTLTALSVLILQLSSSVGMETTRAELLPLYVKLLQDPEAEVRASAARNISGYVNLVGPDRFISDILPAIKDMVTDPAQNVRTAVAESIMDSAPKLGHDVTVANVVPVIMQCLRDEAPEVRLKILEALGKIVDTVGAGLLESLILPILLNLGGDALWRVREKVIDQMPLLAVALVWCNSMSRILCYTSLYLRAGISCFRGEITSSIPCHIPRPGERCEDGINEVLARRR